MKSSEIRDLYQQSHSFQLDSRIESLITSSTLAAETLRFVGCLLQHYQPTYLLEFGSGLSTLFFMKALERRRSAHIFTVDHSQYYIQKTKHIVGANCKITYLHCRIRICQFHKKGFATYDDGYVRQLPADLKFDLVLIDGPPGTRYGREAPLYQIAPFLTANTLVLLDDSNREPEKEALANWQRVWPHGLDIFDFPELKKGLSVIRIKNPAGVSRSPFSTREIVGSWAKATKQLLHTKFLRRFKDEG